MKPHSPTTRALAVLLFAGIFATGSNAWAADAATSASSPTAALAQAPAASVEPVLANFVLAAQGQENLVEPSAEALSKLHQAHPSDVVLMAYAGSATAMLAKTTFLPWKKMKFADDGLALLDKSLALLTPAHAAPAYQGTPAVLDVKLVAANTFVALPGFFNRKERGLKLLAEVAASPLLKTAPAAFQAVVARAQQRVQKP